MRAAICCQIALSLLVLLPPRSSDSAELTVDFSRTNGVLRPLHGGNNGPLNYGELVDLTTYHRELEIPFTRLHDSGWPYPDIVDIHAIFPNFDADPARPESYRFGPTDDYLRAITNTGARIVYRLGESIEHARRKRFVHPPADPEKWAAICAGIIRHYNEGWADGHRFGIQYWEIWNEPENRPAMWTGTPEQYFRLYSVAARAIKARWPELKVGGPSLGHQGDYRAGTLQPSAFLRGFIDQVRREAAPLDFFSWHIYSNDPAEPARRAHAVRAFLDREGFRASEIHLNEWNYLPDNDWKPMTSGQGRTREAWYARQGGAEGAAFVACALMELQSAPVDVANFYSAENQPFGLFTLHGTPKKSLHAFKAFRGLLETPARVQAGGAEPGRSAICAGVDRARGEARILVANLRANDSAFQIAVSGLDWTAPATAEVFLLNASWDLESIRRERHEGRAFTLTLDLPAPAIALVRLRRTPAARE